MVMSFMIMSELSTRLWSKSSVLDFDLPGVPQKHLCSLRGGFIMKKKPGKFQYNVPNRGEEEGKKKSEIHGTIENPWGGLNLSKMSEL